MKTWYSKPAEQVIQELGSNPQGLSADEARSRLLKFGPNKLPEAKQKPLYRILFEQFKSPLIYVLLVAGVIVFALKETVDGFVILFILVFNALLGTIQEGRAQNTLSKLSRLVETRAEVLRGGQELNIPDYEVVLGDIILIQEGERVPADARLIEARNLKTQEAALTGESQPVHKTAEAIKGENLTTGDQKNMVFKGTTVAVGAGKASVVSTGLDTVIGKISKAIAGIDTEIPLTKNLRQLARVVVMIVAVLIVVIFGTGILEGKDFKEMFIASVAISVAAVPEGLPLVLTVTLAAGVFRMAKKRVLVKKLQAVEALGQAKEIAVDKTGTITKNELVIRKVIIGGKAYDIEGSGYEPKPALTDTTAELALAAKIAAFCSNAHIAFSPESNEYRLVGDPTEGALAAFAWKTGGQKEKLLETDRLLADWPFDYQKKFHLALTESNGKTMLAITGAPEVILEFSNELLKDGRRATLGEEEKRRITEEFLKLSGEGFRVIGFAYREEAPRGASPDRLPPLVFGGLFAMHDGLRPGILEAVTRAREIGIRTIMITGDHAATAKTIASQAGIWKEGDLVLTGADLDAMNPEKLRETLPKASVFARVTPDHKMKIIADYRARGEIIAMTGDGVNDAPSLVAADLGIAMGKIGTEVAKEAADLVLLDDNFGDIISAIEEGRNLRQGLRRTITYLFSSNLGEILLIILALIMKLPLPLLAAQIIWMNVVTDTFFDVSLALEPKDPSLMKRKAHIPKKLFDGLTALRLALIAPVIGTASFLFFYGNSGAGEARARTFALTALVVGQWFNAWNCRSETKSVFKTNPFSNRFLLATLGVVAVLHAFAVYAPFMNSILRIEPLGMNDWLLIAAVGIPILAIEEIRKLIYRRKAAAAV